MIACRRCWKLRWPSEFPPNNLSRKDYTCVYCCAELQKEHRTKRYEEDADAAKKKESDARKRSWRTKSSEAHEHRKNKKVEYYHRDHGYTYRLRQHLNMPAAENTVGKIHLLPGEKVEIVNETEII